MSRRGPVLSGTASRSSATTGPSTGRDMVGLRSDELRTALEDAIRRKPSRLNELLARHSGLPGPRPNLALAQAVGDSLVEYAVRDVLALLAPWSEDESAPDRAEVFLPVVAAWGYAALLRDPKSAAATKNECWTRLAAIGADERAPVRLATGYALASFAARTQRSGEPGGGDQLVAAMASWTGLDGFPIEDREIRWGGLATALDAVAERGALTSIADRVRLLEVVSAWITDIAEAPRAAERSEGRRRSLASLSVAAAVFAKDIHGAADGAAWLERECARARHPDLRRAFETSLERIQKKGIADRVGTLKKLDAALLASAKPPRDPTLERKGTRRRGQR
jgi:hypothetical protein